MVLLIPALFEWFAGRKWFMCRGGWSCIIGLHVTCISIHVTCISVHMAYHCLNAIEDITQNALMNILMRLMNSNWARFLWLLEEALKQNLSLSVALPRRARCVPQEMILDIIWHILIFWEWPDKVVIDFVFLWISSLFANVSKVALPLVWNCTRKNSNNFSL